MFLVKGIWRRVVTSEATQEAVLLASITTLWWGRVRKPLCPTHVRQHNSPSLVCNWLHNITQLLRQYGYLSRLMWVYLRSAVLHVRYLTLKSVVSRIICEMQYSGRNLPFCRASIWFWRGKTHNRVTLCSFCCFFIYLVLHVENVSSDFQYE